MITKCPPAASGVHRWLFLTALALARQGVGPEAAATLIGAGSEGCGRYVTDREITDAIWNAYRLTLMPALGNLGSGKPTPKWPTPNLDRIEQLAIKGTGLQGLELASTVSPSAEPGTEAIIDHLFPGNPLLCCGWSADRFATHPREGWRGHMSEMPFIVPSTMTEPCGLSRV